MSVALRHPMTVAEFLAWEERQELRHEFDGFQPVAMNGGTLNHDRITFGLQRALYDRLAGGRCRPFGPNVKILAGRSVRYPDAVVACTQQRGESPMVDSPVVVFEVLSKSTSRIDRIEKVRDYRDIPSIRRYVILEQESIAASVFERDGEAWHATTLTEDGVLTMPEIGVSIPLAECYRNIEPMAFADISEAD
jgi:Uma2 family endonuclease